VELVGFATSPTGHLHYGEILASCDKHDRAHGAKSPARSDAERKPE
jgi:hypothetical protein